jgi:hypothetical protein
MGYKILAKASQKNYILICERFVCVTMMQNGLHKKSGPEGPPQVSTDIAA